MSGGKVVKVDRVDIIEMPDTQQQVNAIIAGEIDLMQIYGLTDAVTRQLRAYEDGLLQSQMIDGEEYPPYLYEGDRKKFDNVTVVRAEQITSDQRRQLFAFGSDTGNLQIGFVMMGVLFLREHNRIARSLRREYPGWDASGRTILPTSLVPCRLQSPPLPAPNLRQWIGRGRPRTTPRPHSTGPRRISARGLRRVKSGE